MTKAEEIAVLRKAAAALGPDSYCGPWLLSVIPEIERDMSNDIGPIVSINEARRLVDRAESTARTAVAQAADLERDRKSIADDIARQRRELERELAAAERAFRAASDAIDAGGANVAALQRMCGAFRTRETT